MQDETLSGYSINRKKYLQVFSALCRNSKKLEKQKSRQRIDEGIISRKIAELEKHPNVFRDFDWIQKKILPSNNERPLRKVVVVKDVQKIDKKSRKKEIDDLKMQILEAKKQYILLKKKKVSEKTLKPLKDKISEMELMLGRF